MLNYSGGGKLIEKDADGCCFNGGGVFSGQELGGVVVVT